LGSDDIRRASSGPQNVAAGNERLPKD
jgi:hypothetical protein